MRMSDADVAQRQPENEEEEEIIQTNPLADQITPLAQRQTEPEEEEEEEPLQAKFKDGEMIQRMCPECEEETAQRQPMEEEEEELQAKSKAGEAPEVTPAISSGIQSLQGGGQSLPPSERDFFEPRFGHDFSQVRVHTGADAEESARYVNAKAFTTGRDVAFGRGQYSPETTTGKKLLAHELTHVVQQNKEDEHSGHSSIRNSIQRFEIKTTGSAPHGWTKVTSKKHLTKLKMAKEILDKVFKIVRWKKCIKYFNKNCAGSNKNIAKDVYDRADLWYNPSKNPNLFGQGECPGSNISYTTKAFEKKNVKWLAGTIVHELMHNCGQTDEKICENALGPCGHCPKINVRDTGGIEPVKPGLPFFVSEVRRLLGNEKYEFLTGVGKDPAWCQYNQIVVSEGSSFWNEAFTSQVEELAQAAVTKCLKSR
ncbi:MAG: DUF4157 domain-containing protein [Planctomycetes bacterium]|nr:DUF4157 domain-containing protein [Planctomycetota bacterium]